MTPELLAAVTGARIDRARTHASPLTAAMAEFRIDTTERQAAFLAQVSHETAWLRFMVELWGPTKQQLRYEPPSTLATDLGNTERGDGHRFLGRGDIMITGRFNYKLYGDLLGVDLIAFPDRASEPELGARIAGLYWAKNNLNQLADAGNYRGITQKVNGGQTGIEDRIARWEVAKNALGVA